MALLLTLDSLSYAESLEGWYQVDLILFKPTEVSLDDEAWPEFEPSYPFDVVSITEPRAFNLSQLEQLEALAKLAVQEPLEAQLSREQFLFESEGNNQRNRRLLESLAAERELAESRMIENHQEVANGSQNKDSVTEIITSPMQEGANLPDADPFSTGTLAYKITIEKSSLKSILQNLNWSSRFQVLNHNSWIQPINAESTSILIQTGQRYDDRFEVEGTLSFSRSRYLHVQTDLWYTQFEPRSIGMNTNEAEFTSKLNDEVLRRYKALVAVEKQRGLYFAAKTHRMIQSRRIRSSELHYLDHPLFGVVVRISRYEPEIPAAGPL